VIHVSTPSAHDGRTTDGIASRKAPARPFGSRSDVVLRNLLAALKQAGAVRATTSGQKVLVHKRTVAYNATSEALGQEVAMQENLLKAACTLAWCLMIGRVQAGGDCAYRHAWTHAQSGFGSFAIDSNGVIVFSGATYKNNESDVYVTQQLSDGRPGWVYEVGGERSDRANGVVIDDRGDVYLVGSFQLSVDFDPGPSQDIHTALENACDCWWNAFLTKLTADGEYLWTKSFRPIDGSVHAKGIARDRAGNFFLVGQMGGRIDFDPGPGIDEHFGASDIYVSKLTPDSQYVWTRVFGGAGFDYGSDLAVDDAGNVYATGIFRGRADFDPGPGTDYHQALLLPIREDTFVTKLHADGSYAWTATYPVFTNDQLAVSAEGDIVLTGSFTQSVDFDPTDGEDRRTPVPPSETGASGDIFVTRLRSDGTCAWTTTIGSPSRERGESALIMPDGGVLVVGTFRQTMDFDAGAGVAMRECSGFCEFLLKLNADGSFASVRTTDDAASLPSRSIVMDNDASLYYTRWLLSTDVDPTCGLDFRMPTGPGGADVFLTKLSCGSAGDADDDGDVDLVDVAAYQNCFTGGPNEFGIQSPCAAGCDVFDLTPDNALDLADFTKVQDLLTGPR
jgi:hypothetical protein